MTDLLHVANLSLAYGERPPVVEDLSFDIAPGECLGLVGPSGSGKSLTATSLLGFMPPGAAVRCGHAAYMTKAGLSLDLLSVPQSQLRTLRGRELGYVAQQPLLAFNPVRSCGKQLLETIARLRPEVADGRGLLRQVLRQVEMDAFYERVLEALPHQLSGGQLQRLLIGNALIGRPRLLIADEPTTALDTIVEAEILQLLDRLRREEGMSMLYITHDLRTLGRLTDRSIDMSGRTIAVQRKKVVPLCPSGKDEPLSPPLLRVEGLTVRYGKADQPAAVDDCSFQVGKQEYVALIGPSGSGKSTVAGWLAGLVTAGAGTASLEDATVSCTDDGDTVRATLGVQLIFQQTAASLNPRMTVGSCLGELQRIHGGADFRQTLRLVGLDPEEMIGRYPHQLSGGQQQRVCIARALAARPRLLVCDEAISALDASLKREVQGLLKRLSGELDFAVLFITHDVGEVLSYADRLLIMEAGRICEQATGQELLAGPSSEIGRRLLFAAGLHEQ